MCWACGHAARVATDFLPLSLYECDACGLAFQPERHVDVEQLYADDYFATYHQGDSYADDERQRRLEARVRLRFVRRFADAGKLLEIGAAAGYFVAEAASFGFDAVGLEPNEEMVRFGRTRLGANVRVGTADDAHAMLRDVDVICAWHVLEHLERPDESLVRLRDSLAAQGLIFVEVPNFASARARKERQRWQYLDPSHHVAQYTPEALRTIFERTGFEPLEVTTIPWADYKRGLRSLLSYGRQSLVVGPATFGPHPWKHELLRAVGRRA
jgi:2-polyprenyl-3-methyl-5-hydroxy-6-metoxy-1,4-benzoquinol methylase